METNNTYSDRGELTGLTTNFKNTTTNYVQNSSYQYEATTGNLINRNDIRNGREEAFKYDELDRLTQAQLNGTVTYAMSYKPNGNIDTKADVGTYNYNTSRPHAMSGITGVQAGVSADKQFISYTAFEKVSQIQQGVNATTITKEYDIYYGLDDERIKSGYLTSGDDGELSTIQTRYYFGSYEKTLKANGSVEETDYIYTPGGLTCLNRKVGNSNTLYYVHTDHMGSIQAITNILGTVVASYAYTPWGERKLLSGDNTITDRGYTGHEHLEAFGLINMNGRVYDPVLARFLSPDPYVQAPDFTQSFNRYSYCWNNPFKYTDPSGKFVWFIPIIVGAAIGGVGYTASVAFSKYGLESWNSNDFWKSVAIGGISGLVTAGIGSAFEEIGNVGHELLRAGAHALANGIIADVSGGDFLQGFAAGGLGSLGGSAFQAIAGPKIASSFLGTVGFSALAGGVGAELTGGDFWKGAAIGAMVGALNHGAHSMLTRKTFKVYDEDGDYIGKIKVLKYNLDGNGLEIELGFKSATSKYSDYNWVQTINTNDHPDFGFGMWRYNDPTGSAKDDNSPFYYTNAEMSGVRNDRGYTLTFWDHPSRNTNSFNTYWRAELSLVGRIGGEHHEITTMYYGFNLSTAGSYLLQPLISNPYFNTYKWLKK